MKKYLHIIIYIAALLITADCSDNWSEQYDDTSFEGVQKPVFNLSTTALAFGNEASVQQFTISSRGGWTAKSSASWLSISPDKGLSGDVNVSVTVAANTSTTEVRTATITLSNSIESKTISVEQQAMTEVLLLDASPRNLSFDATTGTIVVESNVPWSVGSNASWLSVIKNAEGTAFIWTVTQNMNTSARQATITVKGVRQEQAVAVSQTGVRQPDIAAPVVSDITKHSASCLMEAASADIGITESGICFSSTAQQPDRGNAQVLKGTGGSLKNVRQVFALTALQSKTTYWVRSYVVTALGVQYGPIAQFATPASVPGEDDNGTPND